MALKMKRLKTLKKTKAGIKKLPTARMKKSKLPEGNLADSMLNKMKEM